MEIDKYKILISNLPIRQQSFTTKRTTWLKAENQIEWLKQMNNKLFGNNPILTISRQDIFETQNIREQIIKTIYWGYTRGMRGNHFVNILEKIDLIENSLKKLKQTPKPDSKHFEELIKNFKAVKGLGISTYSKLLYFLQLTFNNNPCLILDQRLIDAFASKTYSDFQSLSNIKYDNAERQYLDFLSLTNKLSKDLETDGENIEQFLFIFGNNIKNT